MENMKDISQDLHDEVIRKAEDYFRQGYNCAQAVALSNVEALGGRTEGIIQMSAGFGHGMNAGCTCGALSGGVMAIGMLLAGTGTRGFEKNISEASANLHRAFVQQFGLTCCRGLRKKLSPLKNARCKNITVTTAALTLEVLLANGRQPSTPVRVHSF